LVVATPLTSPPLPRSTLFPYTTLFRSGHRQRSDAAQADVVQVHQQHLLLLAGLVEGQRDRRAAVADMLQAAHLLRAMDMAQGDRSEEHTSELQSRENLVCRLLLEKKKI